MSETTDKPEVLGSADVCRLAHIDRATLTRHVQLGKITPIARLGNSGNGAMIFDKKDAEDYAAAIRKRRVA